MRKVCVTRQINSIYAVTNRIRRKRQNEKRTFTLKKTLLNELNEAEKIDSWHRKSKSTHNTLRMSWKTTTHTRTATQHRTQHPAAMMNRKTEKLEYIFHVPPESCRRRRNGKDKTSKRINEKVVEFIYVCAHTTSEPHIHSETMPIYYSPVSHSTRIITE